MECQSVVAVPASNSGSNKEQLVHPPCIMDRWLGRSNGGHSVNGRAQ